jgi:WXG100 family type VII secretion target
MAMQAALKVDAQVVLSKSGDMKNIRSSLSAIMQQVQDKIRSLTNTWEGEASTAYQAQFAKIIKDIEEMLHIVDEYTRDLDEIAQNYITTEQKVAQQSTSLPGDVFGV